MAAFEIGEIDLIIGRDRQPAWASSFRQVKLRDRHRRRVDFAHFVSAKFAKERHTFAVDGDSVRQCVFGGHILQFYFPALGIKPPDHVPALYGKPQSAPAIENRGMRIISLLDWHFVLCDVASLRVELSYISTKVRGEPNVALTVGNQSVGTGVSSREGIFLKILRGWFKAANLVGHLFCEPQI